MYGNRNDSRKSLFTIGKMDKALAEEFLYVEATMEMIRDAIENLSVALEGFTDLVEDLTETADSMDEKILELTTTVTGYMDNMQSDDTSYFLST